MKLNEKRLIVTGAGAGIGRELVLKLLEEGAYVAALDINEEGLKGTLEKANNSKRLSIFVVDITNDEALVNFKKDYINTFSNIDGIINNAGIIQPFKNVEDLEIETINRIMNVNFYGPLKLTKMFLKELLTRPEGYICNVSSMGGFFPFPGQTIYGASKAALKLFTEGLYAELLDTNVHVTIVLPGAVATDIAKNSNVDISISSDNSKIKMLTAKKAAALIIKGMKKNKFKLYIGSDSKFMNILYKLNDKGAIKYIKKMMQKAMS